MISLVDENFIGIFDEFFSSVECDRTIKLYEDLRGMGYGCSNRAYEGEKGRRHIKQDGNLAIMDVGMDALFFSDFSRTFNERIWKAYDIYAEKYSILDRAQDHSIYGNKIQRTLPGEAYHSWHFENSSRDYSHRLLTWTLYLNDVDEGGETEFLYYPIRIKPKQGMLAIFPGSFTHTHRGNQPLSGSKYISTGWIQY
jgi:hypothetical protein